jgi:adenine-specific DNA-methyltransferase
MASIHDSFDSEGALAAAALALGAEEAGGRLTSAEIDLGKAAGNPPSKKILAALKELIRAGEDPLGDIFSVLRPSEDRRQNGATYTPTPIVQTMVDWAAAKNPCRVVDPGVGSARFLTRAAAAFPKATLVGIDVDPLATLMARANLAAAGYGARARIILGDYRRFTERVDGSTLYIGNPPYVRHHQITPRWKEWLAAEATKLGLSASKLAGLHVYFFLATARNAQPKDFGAFITASEWLDVNYGALVRSLVLGELGGKSITVIDPTAQPFPDAATTAAITTFEIGSKPTSVYFQRIDKLDQLGELGKGRKVHRDRLGTEARWSHLTRATEKPPEGYVELDELDAAERNAVTKFLKVARLMGANKGYVASHRKAWWSVGLRAAAPIISTYMARRPPGFIINKADARHINIAHGLYPRDPLTEKTKKALVDYLQVNISQRSGRTYAGGLTKFEPREMERLFVPGPALLTAGVAL